MNAVFTDLSKLTVAQLMARTRRLFACSIGLFFLLSVNFAGVVLVRGERAAQHHVWGGFVTLAVMELTVWFGFAQTWNELQRRVQRDRQDSPPPPPATA